MRHISPYDCINIFFVFVNAPAIMMILYVVMSAMLITSSFISITTTQQVRISYLRQPGIYGKFHNLTLQNFTFLFFFFKKKLYVKFS